MRFQAVVSLVLSMVWGVGLSVRPGKAGRRGMKKCDDFMKLRLSSSGCETRLAREPARPVVSLAPEAATPQAMRRCANVRAAGLQPRKLLILGAQGVEIPEGDRDLSVRGHGEIAPGVVLDCGAYEEDDPGTWETQVAPRERPVTRRTGNQTPTTARQRAQALPAKKKRPHRGRPVARDDRSCEPKATGESEGPIRAETSGNGVAPGPGRAKRARVRMNFRRAPCLTP